MRFPLLAKALTLAALIFVLLLALVRVQGLVGERQMRQAEAEHGVAESLAGEQTLLGPKLEMHCDEAWQHLDGEGKERREVTDHHPIVLTAWPRRLEANVGARIEPRYRGLFKVNGYLAKNTLDARWDGLTAPAPNPEHRDAVVNCEAPVMSVGLSDARGIREASVTLDGQAVAVLPGSEIKSASNGFHVNLANAAQTQGLHAQIVLHLAGTQRLTWVPVAEETRVHMTSDWPHPSFGGRFLPVERRVTPQGFEAQWQVSALASSAQQALARDASVCGWRDEAGAEMPEGAQAGCVDAFGVGFVDPVNGYVLSDRAVKYGLLFIALTFVAVALIEALRRLRVHPIQYLLVGCALTVFFLLLISLSEHLPFAVAYAAAAAACTTLLAFYGAYLLHGAKPGLLFGAGIGLLYGALYAVLQMEQAALVLGSVLLFAVLAATMIATRRIDWYELAGDLRASAAGGR
jgi:inner membrane protein